ncbi:MAG: phosphoribosylanthranilate isomerase [Endomicrobia bacterium]|nr:phosphoribosylanthranilate isomerase [Endomicrobiia bacterium]MDW8056149.1 phosphoribosylanthranilate isomerase [Elusimicrobiota bacterium]
MTKVKICGITNKEDAFWASSLGADFIGLNFCKTSIRKVSVKNAKQIVETLPQYTSAVGVFVDESQEEIIKICKKVRINIIQLHGGENIEYCKSLKQKKQDFVIIKVFKIKQSSEIQNQGEYINSLYEAIIQYLPYIDYLMFDTYIDDQLGGTGRTFSWEIVAMLKELFIKNNIEIKFFIAGGLNEENVKDVIELLSPWAVDVASGVERLPRRKDFEKMKSFIRKVKSL